MSGKDLISSKFNHLNSEIVKSVPQTLLRQGRDRYSNWAVQNYKWTEDDYNHRGFRAVYFKKLFKSRAQLVCRVLEHCDSRKKLPLLFKKSKLKVASFGCGPGCDLFGFQHFYRKKTIQRIKRLQERRKASLRDRLLLRRSMRSKQYSQLIDWLKKTKVTYTGYDLSSGWRDYVCRLGYSFQENKINKDFVNTMTSVDVAILCYFSHSAGLQSRSYSFWKRLTEKCKAVLVLDTTYDKGNFDHMLSRVGFIELEKKFKNMDGGGVYTSLWSRED